MYSLNFIFLYHIFGCKGDLVRHCLIPVSIPRKGNFLDEFMNARVEADREAVKTLTHIDDSKAVLMQIVQFPLEAE
jgi:hypothetical protein